MLLHMYSRFTRHSISNGYHTAIATNRTGLLLIITVLVVIVGQIQLSADAAQTVQITHYNVTSLNGPSAYYRSTAVKMANDDIVPNGPLPVSPLNAQKLAISDLTRDFYVQMKAIEENEMLIPTIQSALDSADQAISDHNDTRIFNQIAGKIEIKLMTAMRLVGEKSERILDILSETANQVDRLYLDTIVLPSITKHAERRALDAQLDTNVDATAGMNGTNSSSITYTGSSNNGKPIEIWNFLKNADHLHQTNDKNFTTNRRLIEILKEIDFTLTHVPNFRDAFFIPSHKFAGNNNCRNKILCAHHRYMYASSVKWRNVIMVIDYGSTADDPHVLDATKAFGKQKECLLLSTEITIVRIFFSIPFIARSILNLLNESDSLKIILVSNTIQVMNQTKSFITMNSENRNICRQFIESLEKCGDPTNHTLAFEYAFEWARMHFEGDSSESMRPLLVYISRGYISTGVEIKNVLEAIAAGQSRLKQPILINTCAIALGEIEFQLFNFHFL